MLIQNCGKKHITQSIAVQHLWQTNKHTY